MPGLRKDNLQANHSRFMAGSRFPKIIVEKGRFDLWVYEKGLVARGLVMLALFFTLWLVDLIVFPVVKPGRLLPWVLAFFCAAPFIMLAIGQLAPKGKVLLAWRPDWNVTSYYRRWFRAQYSTGFMTLAVVSYVQGNYFLTTGFFIMVPIFITYTWLLESEVYITKKGVATRSGVLAWDAISEVRLFPKDNVMVLTISSIGRYLIPYGIYHFPSSKKIKTAIKEVLTQVS